MVTCSLSIHYLAEEQLLELVTVSKHIALPQTRLKRGDIVPPGHCHLIQGLSVGPLDMLHHHITVDKVRAYPGRVETSPAAIQKHHTHYIIPNVPLLVDLWGVMGGGD